MNPPLQRESHDPDDHHVTPDRWERLMEEADYRDDERRDRLAERLWCEAQHPPQFLPKP